MLVPASVEEEDGADEGGVPEVVGRDAASEGVEGVPAADGEEEALVVGEGRGADAGADEVGEGGGGGDDAGWARVGSEGGEEVA